MAIQEAERHQSRLFSSRRGWFAAPPAAARRGSSIATFLLILRSQRGKGVGEAAPGQVLGHYVSELSLSVTLRISSGCLRGSLLSVRTRKHSSVSAPAPPSCRWWQSPPYAVPSREPGEDSHPPGIQTGVLGSKLTVLHSLTWNSILTFAY